MKTIFCYALLLFIFSCKKTEVDSVALEYSDWYTVKAPVDEVIESVWGEREKTLLIATTFSVFRSTDQGKNWQQVDRYQQGISGIIQHQDTLFVMTGVTTYGPNGGFRQIMANVAKCSVDNGQSWQSYRKYNPYFDRPSLEPIDQKLYINPVTTKAGTTYTIYRDFISGSPSSGTYETPGVITDSGRRIDLPQLHQLKSLYLDPQQRLYVSGSDAVIRGRLFPSATVRMGEESFTFPNSRCPSLA